MAARHADERDTRAPNAMLLPVLEIEDGMNMKFLKPPRCIRHVAGLLRHFDLDRPFVDENHQRDREASSIDA